MLSGGIRGGGSCANLYLVHRVLIGSGMVLGALVPVHGLLRFRPSGEPSGLLLGAAGLAAAGALGLYLRWFARRHAREAARR